LILLTGTLFLFRNEIINWLQQKVLQSADKNNTLSNQIFVVSDSLHLKHRIYSLAGKNRIWPHRVNSLVRLQYLYDQFPGFECDIRFDSTNSKFYIAHDASEINSLSFSDYLQADPNHKLFWLDTKNLNVSNINQFCHVLKLYDEKFALKDRIILESTDTSVIVRLEQLGYLTSLYLPSLDIKDSAACKNYAQEISFFLNRHHVLISQDVAMHEFMTKNFPFNKQIIWDIHFWKGLDKEILSKYMNDNTFLVCLVNVKSPGYR